MIQKNFDYLKDQVKYLGFGENLAGEIREKLEAGKKEFKISHEAKFDKDVVNSTLHFGNTKDGELIFFKRFDLSLKKDGHDDLINQTYFVGEKNNFTLKERYNLLDGRAVYKTMNSFEKIGEGADEKFKLSDNTYTSWRGLDFKQTDDAGNYLLSKPIYWDCKDELNKYPVKGMDMTYDKNRLAASLEKGNLVNVTVMKDGAETPLKMAVNPRMETFNFYNSNMQRVQLKQGNFQQQLEASQRKSQDQSQGQGQQNDQKQNQSQKATDDTSKKNTQQQRKGVKVA